MASFTGRHFWYNRITIIMISYKNLYILTGILKIVFFYQIYFIELFPNSTYDDVSEFTRADAITDTINLTSGKSEIQQFNKGMK